MIAASNAKRLSPVLLATARVTVASPCGRSLAVRALLDQGSGIKRIRMPVSISAVGGVSAETVRHAATISITPLSSPSPSFSTAALIIKSLTSYASKQASSSLTRLADLPWADPAPLSHDPIDLTIGADLYGDLLREGLHRDAVGQLVAHNTAFGWIISGPTGSNDSSSSSPATTQSLVVTTPAQHVVTRGGDPPLLGGRGASSHFALLA